MKLEDAQNNLYSVKCEMEGRKKHKFGDPQTKQDKVLFGCCLVFLLVLLIILPLLLFSSLNPDQEYNNVTTGTATLELSSLGPNVNDLFTLYEVKNIHIFPITQDEYESLKNSNQEFESYDFEQLQRAEIPIFSEQQWLISPPTLQLLTQELADPNIQFFISINWGFTRPEPKESGVASGISARLLTDQNKQDLLTTLQLTGGQSGSATIPNFFPKYLGLSRLSTTELIGTAESFKQGVSFNVDTEITYVDDPNGKYWTFKRSDDTDNDPDPVLNQNENINVILASDKVMGSLLSSIGSLGVIGFYVTIVLAVGKLIRTLFEKVSQRVIYEELPNPDDLIDLCDTIYLARKEEDLKKEERLYNTLIRIFRSPEILLELTGDNQQKDSDEKKDI